MPEPPGGTLADGLVDVRAGMDEVVVTGMDCEDDVVGAAPMVGEDDVGAAGA